MSTKMRPLSIGAGDVGAEFIAPVGVVAIQRGCGVWAGTW